LILLAWNFDSFRRNPQIQLKSKTQKWLVQKNEVLAFVQAKPAEGGAGALVVLLKGQA